MKTITVNASKTYDVTIGSGLLESSGEIIRKALGRVCRTVIVSDDNVAPLYAQRVSDSLSQAGFGDTLTYIIKHGEASKSAENFVSLLNFLADNTLTRSDCLIALGGGVVGDLTGFAASSYLRGIGFIQIPTSLLADVDSSVGGKTAINLNAGKNLAGAFYQPDAVICDTDTLATLKDEYFTDGCAEVIKYGMISDRPLLDLLATNDRESIVKNNKLENVIGMCVSDKRDTVNADERDTGVRRMLNFGHTVGHAIEKLSDFSIPHGHAVAMGMRIVTDASVSLGICPTECVTILDRLLSAYGLDRRCEYSAEELYRVTLSDKKRMSDTIAIIVPCEVGRCEIREIPVTEMLAFIRAGLKK